MASHDFNLAWAPVNRLCVLQSFAAVLATVMPTIYYSSTVPQSTKLLREWREISPLVTKYRRNESSPLSDFALEGVLHAKQLRDLHSECSS